MFEDADDQTNVTAIRRYEAFGSLVLRADVETRCDQVLYDFRALNETLVELLNQPIVQSESVNIEITIPTIRVFRPRSDVVSNICDHEPNSPSPTFAPIG